MVSYDEHAHKYRPEGGLLAAADCDHFPTALRELTSFVTIAVRRTRLRVRSVAAEILFARERVDQRRFAIARKDLHLVTHLHVLRADLLLSSARLLLEFAFVVIETAVTAYRRRIS